MSTALTLYLTNAPATTVPTADLLVTTTGGGLTNKNNTIGTAKGYGELTSQGSTSAWPASSTIPTPSGDGYLWDDLTLANSSASFVAGTWTATIRLNLNASSIVSDLHVRVYRRASNGVYNTIVLMVLSAQTITSTQTNYTLTNTTTAASPTFQPGDQVYVDIVPDITTNTTGSTTTVFKNNVASSSTLGNVSAAIVSPGYTAITASTKDGAMRFRLSQVISRNAAMRFRAVSTSHMLSKNGRMLFKQVGKKSLSGAMRFVLKPVYYMSRNGAMRFVASRSSQPLNGAMRFKLSAYPHSSLVPNVMRRSGQYMSTKRRETI